MAVPTRVSARSTFPSEPDVRPTVPADRDSSESSRQKSLQATRSMLAPGLRRFAEPITNRFRVRISDLAGEEQGFHGRNAAKQVQMGASVEVNSPPGRVPRSPSPAASGSRITDAVQDGGEMPSLQVPAAGTTNRSELKEVFDDTVVQPMEVLITYSPCLDSGLPAAVLSDIIHRRTGPEACDGERSTITGLCQGCEQCSRRDRFRLVIDAPVRSGDSRCSLRR